MAGYLRKHALTGVALSVACVISNASFAQAPVYDVNNPQGSNLEKRIVVLERMVDSRTQMQHRLQQQLNAMQGEIDDLRGSVEVHTNQLEKVLERQRELYLEIDKRVSSLKQSVGQQTPASGSQVSTLAQETRQESTSTPSLSEDDAYDNAVNLILESREYDKAIPAFREFINDYPKSQYAANAHYWLGQLLFNKQNWQEAKTQFSEVANQFKKSSKRAESLLKLGVIEQRLGNNGQAREYLNQVISQYPNSSARKLAESRLSSL
ncbi:tol-pal system protein YbgF [Alteromonas lipotrueiana]|uniref:tol-pal system protein YbgF n=1 Tax=Alteromonas lipotrueiana TaxID=2803815 RepID=UPI001C445747|nr:tol-pal system protein YbgF [Alteromonas lipotrueiana]